jgi:hypothetical protein
MPRLPVFEASAVRVLVNLPIFPRFSAVARQIQLRDDTASNRRSRRCGFSHRCADGDTSPGGDVRRLGITGTSALAEALGTRERGRRCG